MIQGIRVAHRFCILVTLLFVLIVAPSTGQNVDSIISVQAVTFNDTTSKQVWGHVYEYDLEVTFPKVGGRYERILMYYTLKCDPATTADGFACGEWDYSTWTRIWDDSTTHWEIGRFITPYGKGLNLGPDGFTWVFDVTDYGPILNGTKRITSGNNQELLDLRFEFIKGVPPRDPISVQQLWKSGSPSYDHILKDSALAPIQVTLDPAGSMFRINTRPQGGGFGGDPSTENCSEFCDREHFIMLNGTEAFRWNVWKICGSNPVYPQGGTWIYDRAGWCPGDIVTTQHHELTGLAQPGETITLDYGVDLPAGTQPYGHWVFWADLVAYGPPNFANDVGLLDIISPSLDERYSRLNPICSSPVVELRNGGANPVTSITFAYGLAGGDTLHFTWNGTIDFLEEVQIELPSIPVDEWTEDRTQFWVGVSSVNGNPDDYSPNNHRTSAVSVPPRLPSSFDIEVNTNNLEALFGVQYFWEILDDQGNVVIQEKNLPSNTKLSFPVKLSKGCYTFRFVNPAGFGLDFWAIRDQFGQGSLQFMSSGQLVKSFGADFGNEIYFQFRVPAAELGLEVDTLYFPPVKVGETMRKTVQIGPANGLPVTVSRALVFSGRPTFTLAGTTPELPTEGIRLDAEQTLSLEVEFAPKEVKSYKGYMVLNNDGFFSTRYLYLAGSGIDSASSVADESEPMRGSASLVQVTTDSRGTQLTVRIELTGIAKRALRYSIVDAGGTSVRKGTFDSEGDPNLETTLSVIDLPAGTYFLTVEEGNRRATQRFVIVR